MAGKSNIHSKRCLSVDFKVIGTLETLTRKSSQGFLLLCVAVCDNFDLFRIMPKTLLLFVLSVCGLSLNAQQALTPEEIGKLLPVYVKGFQQKGEPINKSIRLGEIKYVIAEKSFVKHGQHVKILLFDFKEAPIMYAQAMRKWKNVTVVKTDTLILQPVILENCSGWESYSQRSHSSQIFLGVGERFCVTLTGEGTELESLRSVLTHIKLENFPKN